MRPPRAILLLGWALGCLAAAPVAAAEPAASGPRTPRAALGVNVGQVNYYNTQVAFLDLVKQAPDWTLGSGGKPVPVDAEGWPTSLAPGQGAGFISLVPRKGRYVATYEGDGDLRVPYGGTIVSRKPGRVEMDLDGGDAHIIITRTNPEKPLRKLAVVPIANEHDHREKLFDARFLELVRPFGVLRFLDWQRINESTQERWEDRPRPTDPYQGTDKGAALEYAIELCNRARADCWLLIPHMADDEYVQKFAETVRDHLDPSLKAYVEYSNEVWNFRHGDWIQKAGERLGYKREWDTRLRYQAHRSVEIFRVFERVLGRDRLVRVLAGQTWDARLRLLAEWEDAYRSADALAVAPYFCDELASNENAGELKDLDARSVAALCVADVARVRSRVTKTRAVAAKLGLPLIAYEGGQHLVTSGALHANAPLQKLLDDANRDPEMGRAYTTFLRMWKEEGGQLAVLYKLVEQPTKWGRWGLLESMWQAPETAPKWQATIDFLERNRPWWGKGSGARP